MNQDDETLRFTWPRMRRGKLSKARDDVAELRRCGREIVVGRGAKLLCRGLAQKSQQISDLRTLGGNIGGAEGNRTPDLCSAIAALSHLSYGPGQFGGI